MLIVFTGDKTKTDYLNTILKLYLVDNNFNYDSFNSSNMTLEQIVENTKIKYDMNCQYYFIEQLPKFKYDNNVSQGMTGGFYNVNDHNRYIHELNSFLWEKDITGIIEYNHKNRLLDYGLPTELERSAHAIINCKDNGTYETIKDRTGWLDVSNINDFMTHFTKSVLGI